MSHPPTLPLTSDSGCRTNLVIIVYMKDLKIKRLCGCGALSLAGFMVTRMIYKPKRDVVREYTRTETWM